MYNLAFSLFAASAVAFPATIRSDYAVKEQHDVPRAWKNVGEASKQDLIHLQIGLTQQNQGSIEQHLAEVSDPRHARYGQHLSADEVSEIIAPSEESHDLVHAWLADHNIEAAAHSPAKDWVHVVIPIEKAEQLLQTKYSSFQHEDGTTVSRAPEWSLPRHLHEHIDVVQPTTSFFRPKQQNSRPMRSGPSYPMSWWESTGKALYGGSSLAASNASISAVCNASFVTIQCLRTVYGTLNYTAQVPDKNSVGIANYLNETNNRADTLKFLQTYRPEAADAANTFPITIIANASDNQGPYTAAEIRGGINSEGNLDAQLVLGIGYPTPMHAYSTGGSPPFLPDLATPTNTNEPYLDFLNYALAQSDLPQVISTSYGDDEQSVPQSYAERACSGFAQLGVRGISVLFSSGDSGVGSNGNCFSNKDNSTTAMFLPAFPTSCPWVTSVGGTAGFEPEVAVSRFGSGAGFSNYFPAPSYQKATVDAYIASLGGKYDGLYNKSGRGYPDVAAQGNHDVIVLNGRITTIGGTSASSPTFAAILGLVNDALIAAGKSPLGFINPWIYGGGYKALTDITSGSSIGCNGTGFPAQVGWDAVTGWGTPNFGKLVAAAMASKGAGAPGGYGKRPSWSGPPAGGYRSGGKPWSA